MLGFLDGHLAVIQLAVGRAGWWEAQVWSEQTERNGSWGTDSRSEQVIKRRKDSYKVEWPLKRSICGWMLLEILPSVVREQKGRWGAGRSSGDGGWALKLNGGEGSCWLPRGRGYKLTAGCRNILQSDPSSCAELGLQRRVNTLLHVSRISWFFFYFQLDACNFALAESASWLLWQV